MTNNLSVRIEAVKKTTILQLSSILKSYAYPQSDKFSQWAKKMPEQVRHL
jgi:hypothetical protein